MDKILRIALDTAGDHLRRKTFYLFLATAIMFVLTLRSCYDADFTVNNQKIDSVTLAWHASILAFHLISLGMNFMAILLAMRLFTRDSDDGTAILYLARPVSRPQYIVGRITGIWLLCAGFMFILHVTVFIIAWTKTGGMLPEYLTASLVCSTNLMFIIILVCLLTFLLPDFMAALTALGLITVGFISEGAYQLLSSDIVKGMVTGGSSVSVSTWRIIYPKVGMLQQYASTLIKGDEFQAMGPVHPFINVAVYCALCLFLTIVIFNRKEVY
ncbi:ABC transporter permease subunit [Thermodesulfobacteriota bacterium]